MLAPVSIEATKARHLSRALRAEIEGAGDPAIVSRFAEMLEGRLALIDAELNGGTVAAPIAARDGGNVVSLEAERERRTGG